MSEEIVNQNESKIWEYNEFTLFNKIMSHTNIMLKYAEGQDQSKVPLEKCGQRNIFAKDECSTNNTTAVQVDFFCGRQISLS